MYYPIMHFFAEVYCSKSSKGDYSLMKRRVRKRNSVENMADPRTSVTGCSKKDAFGDVEAPHLTRDRRQDFDSGFDLCNSPEGSFSYSEEPTSMNTGFSELRSSTPSKEKMGSQRAYNFDQQKLNLAAQHVYRQSDIRPTSVDSFSAMDGIGISVESDDTGVVLSAASGKSSLYSLSAHYLTS